MNKRMLTVFEAIEKNNDITPEKGQQEYYRAKSDLKELLLNYLLHEYEATENFEADLHRHIRLAKYLLNRQQYELVRNILTATKLTAAEYDFHFVILECLNTERLLARRFITDALVDELKQNILDTKNLLQKITIQTEITNHHDTQSFLSEPTPAPNPSDIETDKTSPLYSATSLRFYYSILANIAEKKKNARR